MKAENILNSYLTSKNTICFEKFAKILIFQKKIFSFDEIFFFKQKTAYEIASCLVGSEMCIRDRLKGRGGFVWRPSPLSLELQRTEYQVFKMRY